jgi:hypothetical protein
VPAGWDLGKGFERLRYLRNVSLRNTAEPAHAFQIPLPELFTMS